MRNGLSAKEGLYVVIDNPWTPPNIPSGYMTISPGTETNIAVQKTIVQRQKAPYPANCSAEFPDIASPSIPAE